MVLKLKLGADNREEMIHALEQIVFDLKTTHVGQGEIASGGYSSGYTLHISEDQAVTHDSYFEAIRALDTANNRDDQRAGTEK